LLEKIIQFQVWSIEDYDSVIAADEMLRQELGNVGHEDDAQGFA
jgi:hypothetical protein